MQKIVNLLFLSLFIIDQQDVEGYSSLDVKDVAEEEEEVHTKFDLTCPYTGHCTFERYPGHYSSTKPYRTTRHTKTEGQCRRLCKKDPCCGSFTWYLRRRQCQFFRESISTHGSHLVVPKTFYNFESKKCQDQIVFASCTIKNGGCDHICEDRADGILICECYAGYELAADGTRCLKQGQLIVLPPSNCYYRNCQFRRYGDYCSITTPYVTRTLWSEEECQEQCARDSCCGMYTWSKQNTVCCLHSQSIETDGNHIITPNRLYNLGSKWNCGNGQCRKEDCRLPQVTCHRYADCVKVSLPGDLMDCCECRCIEGYMGDGYDMCRPTPIPNQCPKRDCRRPEVTCHRYANCVSKIVPGVNGDCCECQCRPGYYGDGYDYCFIIEDQCPKEDCRKPEITCHHNADCVKVSLPGNPHMDCCECRCREGYIGDGYNNCCREDESCQNSVAYVVGREEGKSYLEVGPCSTLDNYNNDFTISFDINRYKINGLLLYAEDANNGMCFVLWVGDDEHINIRTCAGNSDTESCPPLEMKNDWKSLVIEKRGLIVTVLTDKDQVRCTTVLGNAGDAYLPEYFYLGGVPQNIGSKVKRLFLINDDLNMLACYTNIAVNRGPIMDMEKLRKSYDVQPCGSMFRGATSYATFDSAKIWNLNKAPTIISMEFSAHTYLHSVMYLARPKNNVKKGVEMSIEVFEHKVTVLIQAKGKNNIFWDNLEFTEDNVTKWDYHHLEVRVDDDTLKISFDNEQNDNKYWRNDKFIEAPLPNWCINALREEASYTYYIGGKPDNRDRPRRFDGCIRNVILFHPDTRFRAINFDTSDKLNHVDKYKC